MNVKTSVKHRRQARIKELLDHSPVSAASLSSQDPLSLPDRTAEVGQKPRLPAADLAPVRRESEPDPEKLWKQGYRGGWYGDTGPANVPPPDHKSSFARGMLRRLVVSALLFGIVWGIFTVKEPWAVRAQLYIAEGLSREMDFQAAQVWYEEHFGGAPSFIPIFGQSEQNSTKVNGRLSMTAPLSGRIVQSFAIDMRGILVTPSGSSETGADVKSVETGRVLEIRKLRDESFSVLIQHTGERTALYSGLESANVKANDWVQGGEVIGKLPSAASGGEQPALYFMLKEGDHPVDPSEVISF